MGFDDDGKVTRAFDDDIEGFNEGFLTAQLWRLFLGDDDNNLTRLSASTFSLLLLGEADAASITDFFEAIQAKSIKDIKKTLKILKQKTISPYVLSLEGSTCLHMCVWIRNTKILKFFLDEEHLDINILDAFQNTPLHTAALLGDLNLVEFLVKRHPKVNVYNEIGLTPLHLGAGSGKVEIVYILLEKGAQVNPIGQPISGMPLHYAISGGCNIQVIGGLLENKARPNEMVLGVTPLLSAAMDGNVDLMKLLLEHHASTNFMVGEGMLQPLDFACLIKDPNIAKEAVEQLLARGADPNYVNFDGCRPIEVAATIGNRGVVEVLISRTKNWDPSLSWDVDSILSYANTDVYTERVNAMRVAHLWKLVQLGDAEVKELDTLQRACLHYNYAKLLYRDLPTGPILEHVVCKFSRCLLKLKVASWAFSEAEMCYDHISSSMDPTKPHLVLVHPKRKCIAELAFCMAEALRYMKKYDDALDFYEYAGYADGEVEEYKRGHEKLVEDTKNLQYCRADASSSGGT